VLNHLRGYNAWHGPALTDEEGRTFRRENAYLVIGSRAHEDAFSRWFHSLPKTVLYVGDEDGRECLAVAMDEFQYDILRQAVRSGEAVLWGTSSGVDYWEYEYEIYSTAVTVSSDDVIALVRHMRDRTGRLLAEARVVVTADWESSTVRKAIPEDVRTSVWQRDRGRCARCDSQGDLGFAHVIPMSLGGANTSRNVELLCGTCDDARDVGSTIPTSA
jgi:hypothetical protein